MGELKVRYRRDAAVTVEGFRRRLGDYGMRPQAVTESLSGDILEHRTLAAGYAPERAEAFTAALRKDPLVVGFDCVPHGS